MVALFVILTFLAFIIVDYFVHRNEYRTDTSFAPILEPIRIPRGFFFARGHTWVQLLFSGIARIGLDDFVQKIVGHIDAITTPAVGSRVMKGDPVITVTQNGKTISLPAPISGTVVDVNPILERLPKFLSHDPYVEGWLVAIEPLRLTDELPMLRIADDAAQWIKAEVNRFRDFIFNQSPQYQTALSGATMLDGGVPIHGVLEQADGKLWSAFQQEFLDDSSRQTI